MYYFKQTIGRMTESLIYTIPLNSTSETDFAVCMQKDVNLTYVDNLLVVDLLYLLLGGEKL